MSGKFVSFCNEAKIKQQLTQSWSPQQNGGVEQINRTFFKKVRSMMIKSKILNYFQGLKLLTL